MHSFYPTRQAHIQYCEETDFYKKESDGGIKLTEKGMELICQYYHYKYHTNIELVRGKDSNPLVEFLNNMPAFLEKTKHMDEFRTAFLLGLSKHTTLIFYLKEGSEEGFLIADSTGSSKSVASLVQSQTGLQVHYVLEDRQQDKYSCYTDGIIMGKDVTRKREGSNEYYYPKLLSYLMNMAEDDELDNCVASQANPKITYLPDFLLKTAQLESFIKKHYFGTLFLIHKNESLETFRKRYSNQQFSTYLFEKGIKFTRLIKIQFYLNQVKNLMKELWKDEFTKRFIEEAKKFIKDLKDEDLSLKLVDFSNNFLENHLNPHTKCNPCSNRV